MFGRGKKKVSLGAVFAGKTVDVREVPDPVFAQRMLGEGFAVIPPADARSVEVGSPVKGTVTKVFKTGHAFVVRSDEGLDVLVHIGLETVGLKGEGFDVLATADDAVEIGTPIVAVDLDVVRGAGLDPITPVVLSSKDQVGKVDLTLGDAAAGDTTATVTLA